MGIDENNFIQQLMNKNSKALDYMLNNHSELIYKVVFSVLGSSNDHQCIEECVNDIFLSIWNNIESFNNNKGSFKSWIIAVSRYKSIDYKRKLIKNSNIECIEDYILASEDSTESIIISKENKNELLSIIKEMKSIDKQIFIRRYFVQEDIEDIAKTLNVSRTVIDNRLSRGRKFLKEKLISLKKEVI